MDTQKFIQEQFAEFYKNNSVNIEAPSLIEKREFGFFTFKQKVMVRHKGFATVDELRAFIEEAVPSHAYYSTAYYDMPEAKMEEKGWLGADLYFDIDADHIPTKCGKSHDTWTCKSCGHANTGPSPEKCPKCGSQSFVEKTWPCEVCLETAKQETIKLLDFLTADFGLSSDEVNASFSGHRGYHVHVENEVVRGLGSVARKEIVDYVTGVGLEAESHGLGLGKSKTLTGPNLQESGWRGRIARGVYEFLLAAGEKDLRSIGLKPKAINAILTNKDAIERSWKTTGPWYLKGVDIESWKAIVHQGIEKQSAKIDTVVTTDVHRLIRMTNTLHGKTGLLKVSFPAGSIEEFDPLTSAVAFKK
ncbi:MAG: DNA primase small subunit PriS, partial [Nitrososphaerota archaeon]